MIGCLLVSKKKLLQVLFAALFFWYENTKLVNGKKITKTTCKTFGKHFHESIIYIFSIDITKPFLRALSVKKYFCCWNLRSVSLCKRKSSIVRHHISKQIRIITLHVLLFFELVQPRCTIKKKVGRQRYLWKTCENSTLFGK